MIASRFVRLFALAAAAALLFPLRPAAAVSPAVGWPRQFTTEKGNSVVVYQPQLESFSGDAVTGRAAVSFTPAKGGSARYGVVFFKAEVSVDRDARTVAVRNTHIERVRFPGITPEREKRFAAILEAEVPRWRLGVSYDRFLENLKVAERERRSAAGLKNDPPRILVAEEPTVLVTFDGEPVLRDVPDSPLKVVVNTPFLVVFDSRAGEFFLAGGAGWWYSAADPRGPWGPVPAPPREIADLARSGGPAPAAAAPPPKIVAAFEPTELIVCEGKPAFRPVGDRGLRYLENSESDVLLDAASRDYFVLLSGRWFRSPDLARGPWSFAAPDALPASFAAIPADSAIGNVRASVPGTDEAEDAVLDAEMPTITAVRRDGAAIEVVWDGAPRWVGISGTSVAYAVNASVPVIRVEGRYYACDDAVWYVADAAEGPWTLADRIPKEAIDEIPPSAPVYNLRYVDVYDATPDAVWYGYTPGYSGCLVGDWSTIVWGTGWYYPPWVGAWYWPWPWTYGFYARYDPWTGWGFGISWGYPFYDASFGWGGPFWPGGWGPWTGGGHWRHRGWWGPRGYRPPISVIEANRTRPGIRGERPSGPGGVPGVRRPNVGIRPPMRAIPPGSLRNDIYGRPVTVAPRPSPGAAPNRPNDVYGGEDGSVYRRTPGGDWQRREGGKWVTPPRTAASPPRSAPPTVSPRRSATSAPPRVSPPPRPQLERDFTARQRGDARARGGIGAPPPRSAPSRPPAPRQAPPPRPHGRD